MAQMELAVDRWQKTPPRLLSGQARAVPWPGQASIVTLACAANGWRWGAKARVVVVGRTHNVGDGLLMQRLVMVRVDGERRPRLINVERFPKLEVMR